LGDLLLALDHPRLPKLRLHRGAKTVSWPQHDLRRVPKAAGNREGAGLHRDPAARELEKEAEDKDLRLAGGILKIVVI